MIHSATVAQGFLTFKTWLKHMEPAKSVNCPGGGIKREPWWAVMSSPAHSMRRLTCPLPVRTSCNEKLLLREVFVGLRTFSAEKHREKWKNETSAPRLRPLEGETSARMLWPGASHKDRQPHSSRMRLPLASFMKKTYHFMCNLSPPPLCFL